MRKFLINVNGNSYEVEVEEIGGAAAPVAAPAPAAAPAAAPAPAPAPKQAAPAAVAGTKVCAPMPGTILDVKANVGASVNEGDVLCVLEAMKMENEVLAPCSGKVAACNTSKGAAVETDAVLFVIA